jgi:hypothetical protein
MYVSGIRPVPKLIFRCAGFMEASYWSPGANIPGAGPAFLSFRSH